MARQVKLSEGVEAYLDYLVGRGSAHTTITNDGVLLRRFVSDVGERQLRHLRVDHVTQWFYGSDGVMTGGRRRPGDTRQRRPLEDSTHNKYRDRLAAFFDFAARRGWLRDDLLVEVRRRKVKEKVRQRPAPATLLALLEVARNARDRCYLATATNTACRASEILPLTVGDVDLNAGELTVVIRKSREVDRLPITVDLDVELRRWLRVYAADLGRELEPWMFLFPTKSSPKFASIRGASGECQTIMIPGEWKPGRQMAKAEEVVKAALQALGLPTAGEGTHTLRRAVARAYFESLSAQGYDSALRVVGAWLHHKSTATTELYLGLTADRVKRDASLRGRPFLSALVETETIKPMRRPETG